MAARSGRVPTPLEARDGGGLGVELWLKREDLIDDLGCGHKARKLEHVVAAARRERATVLVTAGSLPSSQTVAVAAAARRHGLRAHLVYTGDRQARPSTPRGNYLLATLLGAEITWFERSPWAESAARVEAVAAAERERGERPYAIEPGISRWPGLAGSVELGQELAAQLPQPERETWIVAPAGSGGTCLGLAIAAGLGGLPWRVLGVCIGGDRAAATAQAAALEEEAVAALGEGARQAERIHFHDGALGNGYDEPAAAELEAMREALREHQLVLDPNYMLKAFLGLRQALAAGTVAAGSRVVLVHTGGALGIHDPAPAADDWYRQTLSVYLS